MSHEGRMRRGKIDSEQGRETEDAKYFLEQTTPKEEIKEEKPKKEKKK